MENQYTITEQIGFLYDANIKASELTLINKLLSKFSDDDIELINQVCEINFKVGFRAATEILK